MDHQSLEEIFKHPFFWGKTDDEKHHLYNVWNLRAKRQPSLQLPWTEAYRKYYERTTRDRLKQQRQMQSNRSIDSHPMADMLKAMRVVYNANFGENKQVVEKQQVRQVAMNKGIWGNGMRATIKRGIQGGKMLKTQTAEKREAIQLEKQTDHVLMDFEIPPILRNPSEWRKALIVQCQKDFMDDRKKGLVSKSSRIPNFDAVENQLVLNRASSICSILMKQKPILDHQLINCVSAIKNLDDFMWLICVDPQKFIRAWYDPLTWLKRIIALPSVEPLIYNNINQTLFGYQMLEKKVIPEVAKLLEFFFTKPCYDQGTLAFVTKLDGMAKYSWTHFDRFVWTLNNWASQRSKERNLPWMTCVRQWMNSVQESTELLNISCYWSKVCQIINEDTREKDGMRILISTLIQPIHLQRLNQLPVVLIDKVQSID